MNYFISVAILLMSSNGTFSAFRNHTLVCTTEACEQSARYLLDNMDLTTDPCEDFYTFSCGNVNEKNPLPADRTEYGLHEILSEKALNIIQDILATPNPHYSKTVKNAQSLYSNCLKQTDDIALIKEEIKNLGGWLLGSQQASNISLEVLLALVTLTGTKTPIILSDVGVDLMNSSQYIIEVNYAELPVAINFLADEAGTNAYVSAIKGTALALGVPDSEDTMNQINGLIQLGRDLAKIMPVPEVVVNYTEIYKKMTISELQQLTDPNAQTFDWSKHYNALFGKSLPSSEPVAVYNLEYLVNVVQLINSTDRNTVVNFIVGSFIQTYTVYTGGALFQQYVTLVENLTGVTKFETRNTSCAEFTNKYFGYALAEPYVAKAFPASNIQKVKKIAQSLQTAFQIGLSQTPFYDPKTIRVLQEKVAKLQLSIGYPKWINNDKAVETYYKIFPEMNGTHFTNALKSLSSLVTMNLNMLHTKVDRRSFNLDPSTVCSEYDASNNAIAVTAGILQQPFYSSAQLQCLNFGGVGTIIATTIKKAVNTEGAQLDVNGNLDEIWPMTVIDIFEEVNECIIDQFKSYCLSSNATQCVAGTSNELDNIIGMLAAYNAYQSWVLKNRQEPQLPGLEKYSSNQLFFISAAQRFCSSAVPASIVAKVGFDQQLENKYNLNIALASIKEFSEAFQCPPGLMNLGDTSCYTRYYQ